MMNKKELLYLTRTRLFGAVLAAAVGSAPALLVAEEHDGMHGHMHGAENRVPEPAAPARSALSQAGVSIDDVRIRLPLPGQTTAVVYLTLNNRTAQELTIAAVEVAGSERAELHQHVHEDGMMRMRKVNRIVVAAGTALELSPGGYHIMAFHMAALPGDASLQRAYPVTLIFENGERTTANAWPVH